MFAPHSTLSLRRMVAATLLATLGSLLFTADALADDDDAMLVITNNTKKTVLVYWVNRTREVLYTRLQPGEISDQPTFAGHVWVIRDPNTREVLKALRAAPGRQEVNLGAPARKQDKPNKLPVPVPGGFGEADVNDPTVKKAARFAASEKGATLLEVLKAETQVVAGTNYALTLRVRVGKDVREAKASVFHSFDGEFQFTSFEMSGAKPKPPAVDEVQAALELINQERKRLGRAPLAVSPQLTAAARAHTENMAATGEFEHEIGNSTLERRLQQQNYKGGSRGAEENIAEESDPTGRTVFLGWMGSRAHRETMLDGGLDEVGLAAVTKGRMTLWTLVVAKKR